LGAAKEEISIDVCLFIISSIIQYATCLEWHIAVYSNTKISDLLYFTP